MRNIVRQLDRTVPVTNYGRAYVDTTAGRLDLSLVPVPCTKRRGRIFLRREWRLNGKIISVRALRQMDATITGDIKTNRGA
jgi:hypothetical protein